MELLNCTKYNDTHSVCKHIYNIKECIVSSPVVDTNNVGIITPDNFPSTEWNAPIIISIIISICIMLLLVGNLTLNIYRNHKYYNNENGVKSLKK